MFKKLLAMTALSLAVLAGGSGAALARSQPASFGKAAGTGSDHCFSVQNTGAVYNTCTSSSSAATWRFVMPMMIDNPGGYWWRVRAAGVTPFMCEARSTDDGGVNFFSTGLRATDVTHSIPVPNWGQSAVTCNTPAGSTIYKLDYWQ